MHHPFMRSWVMDYLVTVRYFWTPKNLMAFSHFVFAVPPPSPPSAITLRIGGKQLSVTWMQTLGDIVDAYFITMDTMTMLCSANVSTMVSIVSGESRSFVVSRVEEFSTISITVTARNNRGEGSTTVRITTSTAGTHIPAGSFHVKPTHTKI